MLEETDMAVVEPGSHELSVLCPNLKRGTWKGKIGRSVFLPSPCCCATGNGA